MSRYVDVTSITQVIGTVFNNPSLLDQTDKYTITDEDFPDLFHRIVFGAIYKIFELGAEKITLKNVSDFLAERPKSNAIFEKEKGEEWLVAASENATATAFDYYYNRLKKMSLLRAYDNHGIDVSFLYDTDNLFDVKKKQEQEEWLDNTSLEKIAEKVDGRLEEIKLQYVDNTFGEAQTPSDGALELFDRLKQAPDVGVPLYGPLINTVTRGARLRKMYLRSAPSGYGKAIPNDTIIPTPNGYRAVGDIKVGDYLFGQDGKPTKVLNIYPQPEKKEIWKVIFKSGRVAECCSEHLWGYYSGKLLVVKSTAEIYQESLKYGFKDYYKVPMTKCVEYPEKQLPTDPYSFGLNFRCNKIPQDYLFSSAKQRRKLLIGFLDNFGFFDVKTLKFYFPMRNKVFEKDFIDLVASLGLFFIKDKNRIEISIKKDKFDPIVQIIPTEEKTDMTCFTVDNDDHLFLMNSFIVTHNTRTMIADVCNIGCNKIYDENFGWVGNGTAEPTLYITTEQELEEIQTMMWAFLSAVPEDNILNNRLTEEEEERVKEAIRVLNESKIYIIELPDFSLRDVENIIKKHIRENSVKYVFVDYIMTSLKILEEVSGRAGGVRLREDNILFMLSRRLKDIANEYGVFVLSATQLTSNWREVETPDQSLLRGARSICDSIDLGMHLLPTDKEDLERLEPILSNNTFEVPNTKLSVYKNRRGRYKGVYLWCKADLGICRVRPMFATTWDYEIVPIENLRIITEEEGAF